METLNSHTRTSTEEWKKYHILIVDDEPLILDELQTLLELEGFSVTSALSGEEGLQRLKEVPARLVISDQKMDAGMNGAEFLMRAKQDYPDILTMILSAFSESEYLMDAVNKAGVYQYLLKPWRQEDLLDRISQALRLYHDQEKRRSLAQTNVHLLKKLVQRESSSLIGDFSTALYDLFFPILEASFLREKRQILYAENSYMSMERNEWSHPGLVVSKLGQIARFYHQPPNFQQRSVQSIVQSCVTEARSAAKKAGILVDWVEDYASDLPHLLIQHETFSCAIKALIENAVIFNNRLQDDRQRQVCVRVYCAEHVVCIEVKDNGPGISDREKIFFPLYSTCGNESSFSIQPICLDYYNFGSYNHVGLGLTIARWCFTQHDGSVEMINPGGTGSIFRVEIPVEQHVLRQLLGR